MSFTVAALAPGLAQQSGWAPLGPWELIERLDDVQIVKVLRQGDLTPAIFPSKPTWQPDGGDFFPADSLLYNRLPLSGSYYAYESHNIVLDDANIRRQYDPAGVGRFRISRVEIAVYFPYAGLYTIQGFWTGSDDDLPPFPTSNPPETFLRSNTGPHTVFVSQAGVWRLATNPDSYNEVFTVQCGVLDESLDPQRRFNCYVGIQVEPPGAWVCGALPGTDLDLDYFLEYTNSGEYEAYQLQNNIPATFALRLAGDAAGTLLQGTLTINGYTGSYEGKQATIKVKQGTTINTYTTTLDANGSYALRVNETGSAEVLAQLTPGLAKKVSLNLTGTVNQNFALTNGDVNGDNVVDDADLLQVLFNFGGNDAAADVNGDNVVDDADLLIVLFNFGSVGDSF
ncbi:MAG: hypothetical protein ACK4ME_07730 [Fimbriimonadales bacterium]